MQLRNPRDFYRYRCLNLTDEKISPIKKRRRLNNLKKWADSCRGFYLDETYQGSYWNCKLPIIDSIVEDNPSFEDRKECIQSIVDATANLLRTKINNNLSPNSKILCTICIPSMFRSEVTIFLDEQYYNSFFDRHHPDFSWTRITDLNRSLLKEYNTDLPKDIGLLEMGYKETICDEYQNYQGELWAIGELGEW